MAGNMLKATCIVVVAVVLAVNIIPPAEAWIGCGTVVSYLGPCIPYVTGQFPLGGCCGGLGLCSAASTTPDKQSVCNCLKSLASTYNVDLSNSIDCANVK